MSNKTDAASVAETLRDARVALRSALYDATLELLDGCEDWPAEFVEDAIVMKAEVIGRRDPIAAVSYLTTVEDVPFSPGGRFNFAIQFGKAYATVRAFSQAESRYAEARALAGALPYGVNTMAYHDLRMRWFRRDCDVSAPEVQLAIAHPDPSIASAAYACRAWLHAGAENYTAHLADLQRAVAYALMPTPEPVDVQVLAASIHALAKVAFEMADKPSIDAARAASDALAWSPDVQFYRFDSLRALGWDAFMRGRAGEAQWAFKDARMLAPNTAWRVMSHLDRAYVARMSGNEFWAAEELAQADALAYDIRWGNSFGEDRQVLVQLAVLHAPTDAPRAQRYAAMYSQLGTENVDPALALYQDRRLTAHTKYAEGRIEQTLGRREPAVTALLKAYAIYDSASFHYRASVTASALAELTGEAKWRDAGTRHAAAYPDCPLATHADEAMAREDAMPVQLSPLQRQIARALLSGADVAELSRRFSRSMFTIERQLEAVQKAFGTDSRAAFLQEARRRRLA
jgi:DNA-binding CsgD family transcriptional regulator